MSTAPRTLHELLWRAVDLAPDAPAFTYRQDGERLDEQLTFAEFGARVSAVAGALAEQHKPGARVVLVHEPGLAFATSFFACASAGLVPVAAQPPTVGRPVAGARRLTAVARTCDAFAILVDDVEEFDQEVVDPAGALRWHGLAGLRAAGASPPKTPRARPGDLAFLQTTSGSTAAPKGVMLSHRNLLAQVELLAGVAKQRRDSVSVTWAPLFHDMGLASAVLLPLSVPYHSVLMSPLAFVQRPVRWLQAIHRERATLAGGPNFAYESLLRTVKVDERAELDLSSWDFAFIGAEPIRAATIERFTRAFAPVGFRRSNWYCCWGLAESTCVVTGRPRGSGARVAWFDRSELSADGGRLAPRDVGAEGADAHVGCGVALPGHEVLVVDPERSAVRQPGAVGEIWLRGPCVGQGYWGQEDDEVFSATLDDRRGKFLRTGDWGATGEDGELFVVGRMKDMLIVRGRNIAPQDIELLAQGAHPAIQPDAVAAFSVDDGATERVVVLVGARRRALEDIDAIHGSVHAAVVAALGVDADVVVARSSAVLRTGSGKVRRGACRDAYVDGSIEPLAARGVREPA